MLNVQNLLSTRTPFTLASYDAAHSPEVRILAEMVSKATAPREWMGESLDDAEDPCTIAFFECVSLYAKEYAITELELTNAIHDWHRIDHDATARELDAFRPAFLKLPN